MKTKKNIIILFGGRSAEHEVSINSASAVYDHLNKRKFKPICLYISKNGMWKVVDSPKCADEKEPFSSFLPWNTKNHTELPESSVYFPVLHGPYGDDVFYENNWVQDRKIVIEKIKKKYSTPFFIKPSNLGSSIGITKVQSLSQLSEAIHLAFSYDNKILIEEAIEGREFECSVLGNENPVSSLPGEIIPSRTFYDYQDKYIEGKTGFGIPADIPESTAKEIQRISIAAFKSIECSGMARVDFFLQKKSQKIYLNEINTIPGFTEISMYPKLWEASGMTFTQLLEKLITLAVQKHASKKRKKEI